MTGLKTRRPRPHQSLLEATKPGYVCPRCGWVGPLVKGRSHRALLGRQHRGKERPADCPIPVCPEVHPSMTAGEIHGHWPATDANNAELAENMTDGMRDDLLDDMARITHQWRTGHTPAVSRPVHDANTEADIRLGIRRYD
jgi:hypothetical protein